MFGKKRIYLDYAAATPLSPEAATVMQKVSGQVYGNPSAVHQEGQVARAAVENARKLVAQTVQVKPEYVTFTSGGTEANNIAIIGLVEKWVEEGRQYNDMSIVTTKIEHPSVTNACLALEKRGVEIQFVKVDKTGQVDKEHLSSLLSGRTVLVSVAYANSEIGTIQPLHQIMKIVRAAEAEHSAKIMTHIDAAQAPMWLNCQFDSLGADLVSLDFAKCGGPKGVGVLLRSRRVKLSPVLFGGGQESGLRSGTENVTGIVGGAAAFAAAQNKYKVVAEKTAKVRDEGMRLMLAIDEHLIINGVAGDDRIANNINISIPGVDTEYLTVWLDKKGFAVSTKSACSGSGGGESVVVREISPRALPPAQVTARASSTLRITLGPETTIQNLKKLVEEIKNHLASVTQLTQK